MLKNSMITGDSPSIPLRNGLRCESLPFLGTALVTALRSGTNRGRTLLLGAEFIAQSRNPICRDENVTTMRLNATPTSPNLVAEIIENKSHREFRID
jgi:hypothetical protein